jgi:hypothetical protein
LAFKDLVKPPTPHIYYSKFYKGRQTAAPYFTLTAETAEIVANNVTQESYQLKTERKPILFRT